jgi:PhnB protein
MSEITLEPYLFFRGQAREAMEFYKNIFGGELNMMSYGDNPDMPIPEGSMVKKDWVMHASLKGDLNLMASDTEKASAKAAKVDLSIGGSDEVRMREMFAKLSTEGEIITPLRKEFWGDIFGSLTDKYGVNWMFNISLPPTT